MELLEQLSKDVLEKISSGDRVYVDAVLYSTKKHHGGRAIRQANTMGNAAAAKKFHSALIRAAQTVDQLDDDFDWEGEKESSDSSSSHEAMAYGHDGSVNKAVLVEITADFNEAGLMNVADQNKVTMIENILNRCVQLRCDQGFDLNDLKQTYEQRKESLINKYARNGVIPAESKQSYLKALAHLAFIYYEHQVTVRILSNSPLNEQSREIKGSDGFYITYVKSVKWYGDALLSDAQLENLRMPCKQGSTIKVYTDLTVLYIRRNARGKLYVSRRAEDPAKVLAGFGNSSEDDYS